MMSLPTGLDSKHSTSPSGLMTVDEYPFVEYEA